MSDEPIKLAGLINNADPEDSDSVAKRLARLEARRKARAALPATYIDAWATLTWKGHLRLVFGEWLAGNPNYRAAFVMTLEDARELAEDLLERVETRQKKDIADLEQDQTEDTKS